MKECDYPPKLRFGHECDHLPRGYCEFRWRAVSHEAEESVPVSSNSKVVLKCDNCDFKTSTLRPSKAKKRLASHVHGGHCVTDTKEEHVSEEVAIQPSQGEEGLLPANSAY